MEYAVITLNNNQYLVKPGAKITILGELGKVGDSVNTAKTLLVKDGAIQVGTPELDYPINLKIAEITKTDKVDIFKYRGKSRYRRHTGHRQVQTVLEVVAKVATKAKTTEAKAAEPKKATPKAAAKK